MRHYVRRLAVPVVLIAVLLFTVGCSPTFRDLGVVGTNLFLNQVNNDMTEANKLTDAQVDELSIRCVAKQEEYYQDVKELIEGLKD